MVVDTGANSMVKRIDKNTDVMTLKSALEFYTERVNYQEETNNDSHSLEYYKLMVEHIKDLLAVRSTQCPTAN